MELYAVLAELGISVEEIGHESVFTIEEAGSIKSRIDGTGCKNLFLTDKAKSRYLLVILEESRQADLKRIAALAGTSRLSFAGSGELWDILRLSPGSVSPFGIIHDGEKRVTLMIDAKLQGRRLLFHPNVNTRTMAIWYEDLIRFIEFTGHRYEVFSCS